MDRGASILAFIIIDCLISNIVSKGQDDTISDIQGNDKVTEGT